MTHTNKKFDQYLLLNDASTLTQKLKTGELNAETLTMQTLAAIEYWNPKINCFISIDAESALKEARKSDKRRLSGQLLSDIDGLTVAVKDNIDVKGFVTTAGLALKRPVATTDAYSVQQLRQNGCILLGKLNLHAVALGATNENVHFGNCYNPHCLTHTPGGSSGGSAAAVAAGLCVYALGTDTMGSIRIPASYCGVAGIKPSRGATSLQGCIEISHQLDTVGTLARSAGDLEAIQQLMISYDKQCPKSHKIHFPTLQNSVDSLCFSFIKNLDKLNVEPHICNQFEKLVSYFSKTGIRYVEKPAPNYDLGKIQRAGLLLCETTILHEQKQWLNEQPEAYPQDLLKLLNWAKNKSAVDIIRAEKYMDDATLILRELMSFSDFLILPSTPQTCFNIKYKKPTNQADLTLLANMTGSPAISIPMSKGEGELPYGLQIIGPIGSDFQLIQIARWLKNILKGL